MANDNRAPASAASTRWVELVVALLIVAAGVVVLIDSFRVGMGWGADGPQAGYFPNIIGWILTATGLWIAGVTLSHWKSIAGASFVSREELGRVLAMFLPTAAYIIVLALIGIYVASALYIRTFMIWQGRYRLLPTPDVSIG